MLQLKCTVHKFKKIKTKQKNHQTDKGSELRNTLTQSFARDFKKFGFWLVIVEITVFSFFVERSCIR